MPGYAAMRGRPLARPYKYESLAVRVTAGKHRKVTFSQT
jgi:hypothetical protein